MTRLIFIGGGRAASLLNALIGLLRSALRAEKNKSLSGYQECEVQLPRGQAGCKFFSTKKIGSPSLRSGQSQLDRAQTALLCFQRPERDGFFTVGQPQIFKKFEIKEKEKWKHFVKKQ